MRLSQQTCVHGKTITGEDQSGKPAISQVEAAADALSVEAGYSGLCLLRKRQSRCGRIGLPLVNTL